MVAGAHVFFGQSDIYGPYGFGVKVRPGHVRVHQADAFAPAASYLAEHYPKAFARGRCRVELRTRTRVELFCDKPAAVIGVGRVTLVDIYPPHCNGCPARGFPTFSDADFLIHSHLTEVSNLVLPRLNHHRWIECLSAEIVVRLKFITLAAFLM